MRHHPNLDLTISSSSSSSSLGQGCGHPPCLGELLSRERVLVFLVSSAAVGVIGGSLLVGHPTMDKLGAELEGLGGGRQWPRGGGTAIDEARGESGPKRCGCAPVYHPDVCCEVVGARQTMTSTWLTSFESTGHARIHN